MEMNNSEMPGEEKYSAAPGQTCLEALAGKLSGKKLRSIVACGCSAPGNYEDVFDTIIDLHQVPPEGNELTPIYADSPLGLEIIRHSCAHIMAEAVKKLFPAAKVTIGPAIAQGFYYDFDFERPFTPEDLEKIEAEMRRLVAQDAPFSRREISKEEAVNVFAEMDENYKVEIIEEIEAPSVSLYTQGDFTDLCRGPHLPSSGHIGAFKLLSAAGAYWRGDERNPMLQRIYGTAFANEKSLKAYLNALEEAKKRDHRKLGQQLELFTFSEEIGPGMVIWLPKGALIRTILEDFERKEHLKRGYQIVQGPQILRRELWEKSGHYDNYRENMYFTSIDDQAYGIKPMNCLAHMIVYKSKIRSYRDLPQRYFELGVVHRHERSGVLHGLLRVRQFTQDDAHIICRPDQLQEEILEILKFVNDVLGLFGFESEIELSTRPEKSIGSDEDWNRATKALAEALNSLDVPYEINEGDGAFYGPKIDIKLKDALERKWQCATIQCDFTLPERFDLVYTDKDGERRRPVMLHRVILGAVERFIGVLIEHTAGAFPLWLAPEQARILTVTDAQAEYALKCQAILKEHGIRCEVDLRNEKLGFKVREAQMNKIPYMLVTGDAEVAGDLVSVRQRTGENLGVMPLTEFKSLILEECRKPFISGGMRYNF